MYVLILLNVFLVLIDYPQKALVFEEDSGIYMYVLIFLNVFFSFDWLSTEHAFQIQSSFFVIFFVIGATDL